MSRLMMYRRNQHSILSISLPSGLHTNPRVSFWLDEVKFSPLFPYKNMPQMKFNIHLM